MRIAELWKPLLALVLAGYGFAGMLSSRPVEHGPGVLVPREPVQLGTDEAAFRIGSYEITPRARYDIEARVLAIEPYRVDAGAKLSPLDFAVGWGQMSDSGVLEHFRVTQGARFFTIYPDEQAIDLRAALLGSANIHLIPATESLREQLRKVRTGHVVRMQGLLVDVSGPGGYTWRTSLARTDSGAGACELLYVESIERR